MVLKAQPIGHQLLGRKLAALGIPASVLWLPLDSAERVGLPGLQACESLGWLRCFPLKLVLFTVAVEMTVAQMLKLHLSFVKVSVALVAGPYGLVHLPCFECC